MTTVHVVKFRRTLSGKRVPADLPRLTWHDLIHAAPVAAPAPAPEPETAPVAETARDRKNRLARERRAAKKLAAADHALTA